MIDPALAYPPAITAYEMSVGIVRQECGDGVNVCMPDPARTMARLDYEQRAARHARARADGAAEYYGSREAGT